MHRIGGFQAILISNCLVALHEELSYDIFKVNRQGAFAKTKLTKN